VSGGQPHAVVIGAGIAGLAAAIALTRAGFHVRVHERATTLEPIGAALSLWPNAIAALRILGAAARVEAEAAPISALGAADTRGRWIFGPVSVTPFAGCGAYLPTRALLQQSLLETLGSDRVQLGSDGHRDTGSADLIIDASGIWSETARAIGGGEPKPAGYGGVLALTDPIEAPPLPAGLEYWGDDERFGLFDVRQGRRYWFWIAGDSLCPTKASRADIAERMADWPEPASAAVAATPPDRLIPVTIHARPAPRRLFAGKTICVGDAGHAMAPNLGQGAAQGLEDAIALLIAARSVPMDRVPTEFERLRLVRVRQMVARSAQAALPVHGPRLLRAPARALLRAIPAALHRAEIAKTHRWPATFAKCAEAVAWTPSAA